MYQQAGVERDPDLQVRAVVYQEAGAEKDVQFGNGQSDVDLSHPGKQRVIQTHVQAQ